MVWLILIGLLSGIVGGMGMGGGTLMVPLLSLVGLEQVTVQGINLVAFVPMCCMALLVHGRGGRVHTQHIWYILLPSLLSAILGSYIAHHIEGSILSIMYGCMLLAVGVWQLVVAIRGSAPTSNRRVLRCARGVLRTSNTRGRR